MVIVKVLSIGLILKKENKERASEVMLGRVDQRMLAPLSGRVPNVMPVTRSAFVFFESQC